MVDPGVECRAGIEDVLAEHRLRPVAVMLTHGHIDHMFSVLPVCGGYGIPAYIHPDDRSLLADPWAGVSGETRSDVRRLGGPGSSSASPTTCASSTTARRCEIAGMQFTADHAPGHTPGRWRSG